MIYNWLISVNFYSNVSFNLSWKGTWFVEESTILIICRGLRSLLEGSLPLLLLFGFLIITYVKSFSAKVLMNSSWGWCRLLISLWFIVWKIVLVLINPSIGMKSKLLIKLRALLILWIIEVIRSHCKFMPSLICLCTIAIHIRCCILLLLLWKFSVALS